MCGICGFISYDRGLSGEDEEVIRRMTDKLIHRGPDSNATLVFDNVALGFTRLSIIGLDNGMQPIYNEDKSLILICNGEIFNYIELRNQLIKKGHIFRTASDVEVILHLYEDHGTDFLNELNGQFAFALYDKRRKQIFCVRDQMGIIPFFYTFVNRVFVFGSEIKAILEHPLVTASVDLVGLDQVFTFAGLISPRTMFKNIQSLENGHLLIVNEDEGVKNQEYWDLIYPEGEINAENRPESYYIDRVNELLDASIALRLRADVTSGLYVSGGLDSSIIASKVSGQSHGTHKEAFSIDVMESLHSESNFQKLVATDSNLILNQKVFLGSDVSHRLKSAVYYSECPIKETYNTASLLLSESVRAKCIKVVLSGEGADEFFSGYVGYRFDKMRAMNLIKDDSNSAERQQRQVLWGDESFFYEKNYLNFEILKKKLYSKDIVACFDEVNCLRYPIINKERIKNRDIGNKRAYIDYKIRLVDHLVSDHGDRMAMANSVEARYPFLDKNLVEFSAQIPSSLKLKDFTEKYILKKIAENTVSSAIIEREKFHFIAPGSPYLLQNRIEYVNDLLSYDLIKKQGYFNPDYVEMLKNTYKQTGFNINAPYESDLLITVITFGILLDTFFKS